MWRDAVWVDPTESRRLVSRSLPTLRYLWEHLKSSPPKYMSLMNVNYCACELNSSVPSHWQPLWNAKKYIQQKREHNSFEKPQGRDGNSTQMGRGRRWFDREQWQAGPDFWLMGEGKGQKIVAKTRQEEDILRKDSKPGDDWSKRLLWWSLASSTGLYAGISLSFVFVFVFCISLSLARSTGLYAGSSRASLNF